MSTDVGNQLIAGFCSGIEEKCSLEAMTVSHAQTFSYNSANWSNPDTRPVLPIEQPNPARLLQYLARIFLTGEEWSC
jgi:hypothetical protein